MRRSQRAPATMQRAGTGRSWLRDSCGRSSYSSRNSSGTDFISSRSSYPLLFSRPTVCIGWLDENDTTILSNTRVRCSLPDERIRRTGRVRHLLAPVAAAVLVSSAGIPGVAAQPALPALTIIAPAAPGGGWDQLAREMQREIERQALTATVQVENVPGAAGTIGLAQFINGRRGDGQALLVNGLVMLGAILWNQSPVSITQVTPIARLTGEYEIVAVPATSPHRDMQSLVRALRENPAAVSWGGGSAGGTDHILAGLIVAAAGVDPRRTNYIAFSGGGEAVTALLGGQVTAGISGYSEFAQHIESGRLRAIGISAPRRLADLDVPTLIEQGLDVELENWRAVVAPPGLSEAQRQALTAVVERMAHSESWRATLTRLGWTDSYLAGPAFDQFLDAERVRVGRIVARLRGPAGERMPRGRASGCFPCWCSAAARSC